MDGFDDYDQGAAYGAPEMIPPMSAMAGPRPPMMMRGRGRGRGAPPGLGRGGMRGRGRGAAAMGGGGDWNNAAVSYGGMMGGDAYYPSGPAGQFAVLLSELKTEEAMMAGDERFKHARKLLAQEANKITNNYEMEYVEVDEPTKVKVVKKVLLPSVKNVRFNFVGKVLGPGGKTLQGMAKQFRCHFYICGAGSTRDQAKEQDLLMSGDPEFAHYAEPTHIRIETEADVVTAYKRISEAFEALSSILQPVHDDPVSKAMQEIGQSSYPVKEGWKTEGSGTAGVHAKISEGGGGMGDRGRGRGRGRGFGMRGRGRGGGERHQPY